MNLKKPLYSPSFILDSGFTSSARIERRKKPNPSPCPPKLYAKAGRRTDSEESEKKNDSFLLLGFIITAFSLAITYFSHAPIPINWSIASACIMGIAQSCAFLPGISRLAITCCAGYLYGYSLADAFFLSWLIQAPLMAAAIVKAVWPLKKYSKPQRLLNPKVVLVILGSSGISWILLCAVEYSISMHIWYLCAWYMIIPITILIWLKK